MSTAFASPIPDNVGLVSSVLPPELTAPLTVPISSITVCSRGLFGAIVSLAPNISVGSERFPEESII